MRGYLPAITAVLLLTLPGCTRDGSTTAPAPPAATASVTGTDPPGTVACAQVRAAVAEATLMDAGVADAIAAASAGADAPIADAGSRLADAYRTAMTASGSEGEPDAVAAVSAAGAEMAQICDEAGIGTVG